MNFASLEVRGKDKLSAAKRKEVIASVLRNPTLKVLDDLQDTVLPQNAVMILRALLLVLVIPPDLGLMNSVLRHQLKHL